jgi:putative ABC transport system permease protein
MNALLQDIRYSIRQLFKTPGFTLTAIVSLALGIGATTAVFSVIQAILLNPYPYKASDRMAHLRTLDETGQENGVGLTIGQMQTLKKSPVVEEAFATDGWNLTITGRELPEDVNASYLTANTFDFLGVPAALGRGLRSSDAIDGHEPEPVVVLSYKFWQRHFGSNPAVVGEKLQLVRKPYTIVGVAAPRFTWDDADVYLPLKTRLDPTRSYYVGVRIKKGIDLKTASAALEPLIQQFAKDVPQNFPKGKFRFRLAGLNDSFEKQLGGTLALLFAAVALLLFIGCGNVSILQLARGVARQNEFAVRAAIGASRQRLMRQMLVESLLLSVIGAAVGVLLAYRATTVISDLLPRNSFPHEAVIDINIPVLIFSVALAILTGLLFGLWPSIQSSRPDIMQVIQSTARRVTGGSRGRNMTLALIAGQIALTLVMLAGAGAAMRGFLQLLHTQLGYDPHNIMSVGIPAHEGSYPTWAARAAYFEELRDRVATIPGVTMAAISTNATPPSNGWNTSIEITGKAPKDNQRVRINFVNSGYFPILRIPLKQGRLWTEVESHNGQQLVVINESMARKYFPEGAIGQSIQIPELKNAPPFQLTPVDKDRRLQIVGVVADKKNDGLRNPILPEAFLPFTLGMRMGTQILVRANGSPLPLLHAIGKQVNSVDADQQINGNVADLDHWIQDQPEWAQEHLVAWLFGAFATLALALAATGLYSVVSFIVQQRTSEFGIRMALGAQRGDIMQTVFSSMAASILGGLAIGIVLTFAMSNILARWAEGSSRDIVVLLTAVVVLGATAALACFAPARRASSVDPLTALHHG